MQLTLYVHTICVLHRVNFSYIIQNKNNVGLVYIRPKLKMFLVYPTILRLVCSGRSRSTHVSQPTSVSLMYEHLRHFFYKFLASGNLEL